MLPLRQANEHVRLGGNSFHLNWRGSPFESQPVHRVFFVVLLNLHKHIPELCLKLSYNRLLPDPFQFVIQTTDAI
jgi:hypothetical protein